MRGKRIFKFGMLWLGTLIFDNTFDDRVVSLDEKCKPIYCGRIKLLIDNITVKK